MCVAELNTGNMSLWLIMEPLKWHKTYHAYTYTKILEYKLQCEFINHEVRQNKKYVEYARS